MLIEILKHTPIWVFFLFALLVRLGFVLARSRDVSVGRAVMVPLVMSALSVAGVVSAFPGMALPIVAWAGGLVLALGGCVALNYPRGVAMTAERRVHVPGSWVPMGLMMTIFFTKFAVGMTLAMQPGLAHAAGFAVPVSMIYGAMSGAFLVRALAALRVWWKAPAEVALAGA
ncbi:MAG TPA: hypothetical protein PLW86_08580 [Rhodocyclaceae bacterium]|nr:hypothetical protein [Rhodocyclaceae bacterium]